MFPPSRCPGMPRTVRVAAESTLPDLVRRVAFVEALRRLILILWLLLLDLSSLSSSALHEALLDIEQEADGSSLS